MKIYFKIQLVISIVLLFVIFSNSIAQGDYSIDHQSKNKFYHSKINKPMIEQTHLFESEIPQKFLKNNFIEDKLDSVIYFVDGEKFRESLVYDGINRVSRLTQVWDTISNSWLNNKRVLYINDQQGNILINLFQNIDDSIWVTENKHTCTYDEYGNMLTWLIEKLDLTTGNLKNDSRYEYNYNPNNSISWWTKEIWEKSSQVWQNKNLNSYTYNDLGDLLSRTIKVWAVNSAIWSNSSRRVYSYSTDRKLLIDLYQIWNSVDQLWVNNERELSTYDELGHLQVILKQIWISSTEVWESYTRDILNNDAEGNILSRLSEFWHIGSQQWRSGLRSTYTYDEKSNLESELEEYWDQSSEEWIYVWLNNYLYDSNSNIYNFKSFTWNSEWILSPSPIDFYNCGNFYGYFCSELTAYYSPLTNINDSEKIINNFSLSQNYPNPFNPSTTIKFTIPTSPLNPSPYQGEGQRERLVTLKVYDILGNEITTLLNEQKPPGTYEIEFYAQNLPSGVYFYQITASSFNQVKKMLLLK